MCNLCNLRSYNFNAEQKEATEYTKKILAGFHPGQANLSIQKELAKKGCLKRDYLNIKDIFNAEQYKFLEDLRVSDEIHPYLLEHAKLNMNVGLFIVKAHTVTELVEQQTYTPEEGDVFQVRGYDLANMTLVKGKTGWIIMDVLTTSETANAAMELVRKYLGDYPVKAIIYSHSHIDHYGGVGGVIADTDKTVQIIAPKDFMKYAVSENVTAGNAMSNRAVYMYGAKLGVGEKGQVDAGLGKATAVGTNTLRRPTVEMEYGMTKEQKYPDASFPTDVDNDTDSYIEIHIDGLRFQIQMTPGTEAPVEMNVYMPDKKILFIAENCTGTLHNLYTLRGAEVRDALEWARYLDETIATFGPNVETICSSHNWPHFGQESCNQYMELQRDAYRYLANTTLHLINQGYTMDEVGRKMEELVQPQIWSEWCNHGFYGSVNHNAKAIYQKYLGWYDGNPSNLNRLEPVEAATKYVECMGGIKKALLHAHSAYAHGEYAWAAELLNRIIFAKIKLEDAEFKKKAQMLNADTLEQLGYQSESAPWRNEYLTAALCLRRAENPAGKGTDAGVSYFNDSVIEAMTPEMLVAYAGIMFKGYECKENEKTLKAVITFYSENESKENTLLIQVSNGVLYGIPYSASEKTCDIATGRITKLDFYHLLTKQDKRLNPISTGEGIEVLKDMFAYTENFPASFAIVTPRHLDSVEPCWSLDMRKLVLKAARMIEKYEVEAVKLGGEYRKDLIELRKEDMEKWKELYPKILKTTKEDKTHPIADGVFFKQGEVNKNTGIGIDGKFHKIEYAHFLYECYKTLYLDAPKQLGMLHSCIEMLEPYVGKFCGQDVQTIQVESLSPEDSERWHLTYLPILSEMNVLADSKFAYEDGRDAEFGIGTDGRFDLTDLCNVLQRCYKLLLLDEFAMILSL